MLFGLEFSIATFPSILVLSAIASVVVSLLTKPDTDEVLKDFYRKVRPWGFWKPIHEKVVREDPTFQANKGFKRDGVNVAVGIVWQLSWTLIPIYLVIRKFTSMWITIGVLVGTSAFPKKSWYDRLEQA